MDLIADAVVLTKYAIPTNLEEFVETISRLGQSNPALFVLVTLMFLDVVTGVMASWICKEISSSASYKGMVRKIIMLALVATARVMENVMPNAPLMTLGCIGFSCTEVFSIVENAGRAGVPLPNSLKIAFEKFREGTRDSKKSTATVEVNTDSVTMEAEEIKVEGQPSKFKHKSDVVINIRKKATDIKTDKLESVVPKEIADVAKDIIPD